MNKGGKHIIFLITVWFFYALHAQGQDLHFSQFYNNPIIVSAANTGFSPNSNYRIGLNYRTQWSSILQTPYRTFGIWADAQLFQNKFEYGWIGLGGGLLRDEAGAGQLTRNIAYGTLAYHQMLGSSSLLSAGFGASVVQKRIDITKLRFPDQFNGKFFTSEIPTGVVFTKSNILYSDLQAGINYAYFPTDEFYISLGYALHHVNKPTESFFGDNSPYGKIPFRHVGFANAYIKVDPRVILNPNVYFTTQNKSMELTAGLSMDYHLTPNGDDNRFIVGGYFRYNDAVIPYAGFEMRKVRVVFSYDVTTSTLRAFNAGRGAFEISLIKQGDYEYGKDKVLKCPSF